MALLDFEQINNFKLDRVGVLLHLYDLPEVLNVPVWAGVLRLYNLFQFLEISIFITANGLTAGDYASLDLAKQSQNQADFGEWEAVYQEVLSEVKSLVKLLANYNFTIPEVGYEATAENSEIIAEFELAWPDIFVGLSLVEEQQINNIIWIE